MEREKRRRREAEARKQQVLSSSGDGGRLVDYQDGTENDLVRLTFVIRRTSEQGTLYIYEAGDFVPCREVFPYKDFLSFHHSNWQRSCSWKR